ncbi:FAD binding domain-containing protein [Nonomuraea salmonea]|uniref:FAD binding domain-containing protein n=1 Tax=Nonomuraea salmonea TaxID=46181 RepID=UPI003CD065F1
MLAGGQSLIPMLNMRLAAPGHLVDINRVAGLDGLEVTPEGVRVGALVRHSDAERAGAHPLLTQALKLVAHPVIRNRGTVVGSLVHADPAAELPAVLAVLGGSVRLARWDGGPAGGSPDGGSAGGAAERSAGGVAVMRDVPAAEFFVGPMESAARPGELAVSAFFPAVEEGVGGGVPRGGAAARRLRAGRGVRAGHAGRAGAGGVHRGRARAGRRGARQARGGGRRRTRRGRSGRRPARHRRLPAAPGGCPGRTGAARRGAGGGGGPWAMRPPGTRQRATKPRATKTRATKPPATEPRAART